MAKGNSGLANLTNPVKVRVDPRNGVDPIFFVSFFFEKEWTIEVDNSVIESPNSFLRKGMGVEVGSGNS